MADNEKILCFTCKRCKGIEWRSDDDTRNRYLNAESPICDRKENPATKCPEYVRGIGTPICFTCKHFKSDKLKIESNDEGHEWINDDEHFNKVCRYAFNYVGLHLKCPAYDEDY